MIDFEACKSVFLYFWWKTGIEPTFSQLSAVFWTCFKDFLTTNIYTPEIVMYLIAHIMLNSKKDNITLNKTNAWKRSREATNYLLYIIVCRAKSLKVVDIWQSTRTSKLWVKLLLSDVNITVASTQYDHICKKIQ